MHAFLFITLSSVSRPHRGGWLLMITAPFYPYDVHHKCRRVFQNVFTAPCQRLRAGMHTAGQPLVEPPRARGSHSQLHPARLSTRYAPASARHLGPPVGRLPGEPGHPTTARLRPIRNLCLFVGLFLALRTDIDCGLASKLRTPVSLCIDAQQKSKSNLRLRIPSLRPHGSLSLPGSRRIRLQSQRQPEPEPERSRAGRSGHAGPYGRDASASQTKLDADAGCSGRRARGAPDRHVHEPEHEPGGRDPFAA
jgi:hypothetical protein